MNDAIINLIMTLSRLPGVATKSAKRVAYFLLDEPFLAKQLIDDLVLLQSNVKKCEQCGAYAQAQDCPYCEGYRSDGYTLCIVEKPIDLLAIESSGAYQGRYHVLGGALSPIDGIGPDQLSIAPLLRRLQDDKIKEVIIATSLNLEGNATAAYLESILRDYSVQISRIRGGVSVGSALEQADKESLAQSLRLREEL